MAIKILMPSLSPTMTKGVIAKWDINEGDKIRIGDLIAEIETDKAIMEFESVDQGFMGPILYPEGSEIEVGTHIGWILSSPDEVVDNNVSENNAPTTSVITDHTNESKLELNIPDSNNNISYTQGRNAKSTPAARARAKELGISVDLVTGSGPMGRVQESDIIKYRDNIESVKKPNTSNLTNMQRVIAERMSKSKQEAPHFYLQMNICIDKLHDYKNSILLVRNLKTTLTHWFVMITARSLIDVPEVNSAWKDGSITTYDHADISVAVSIEGGLITPILKSVDKMKLSQIVDELNHLINKAKSGKLQPNEYQGGNITISNMGMFGVDSFYPIINQPQAAILGIGNSRDELYMHNDIVMQKRMITITMSADHRVINGADAAKFMQKFKEYVENPQLLLI